MPGFVSSAILRLLPISFFMSCFEVIGLLIIVPVIQILIKPEIIQSNTYLQMLYVFVGSPTEITFVIYLLVFIVLFFVFKNVVTYWASFLQTRITYRIAEKLTSLQFQNYLYQSYAHHVKYNTSILLRKIIEIPYNFTNGIMLPVVQLINEIIVVCFIVAGVLVYNSSLFVSIVLFVTPFFLLYSSLYKKQLKEISAEREEGQGEMYRHGKQGIEGFREILLFDKFSFFEPVFTNSVNRFSKAMAKLYHLNTFSPKIIEMLAILCVLVIFFAGLVFQFDLERLVAFLAMFAIAAYRLIPSVNKMILSFNNIRATEFVFDHFRMVQWPERKVYNSPEDAHPLPFEQSIQLQNISISFTPGISLLDNLNLTIKKGEIVGIVGKSGSGKSTLINIILGLIHPTAGKIVVDSTEITDKNINRWHKTISFVPQSPVLLEGTIRENIAFGLSPDQVDENYLEWAIENSGLHDFISVLPLKTMATIGDKSLNISGGQKQRIAIARALYHSGKVLIFDEATSSLDAETESLVTESIKRLADQHYTIIIIAHRMEILKYCNRIYKLKEGKLSDAVPFKEVH